MGHVAVDAGEDGEARRGLDVWVEAGGERQRSTGTQYATAAGRRVAGGGFAVAFAADELHPTVRKTVLDDQVDPEFGTFYRKRIL